MSEYVSHCVSLWNGRIDSHWAVGGPDEFGNGEKEGEAGVVACCGMDEQGQASPSETPLIVVRDSGQMAARPFMSTFHRTGRTTMGDDDACVVGWARR